MYNVYKNLQIHVDRIAKNVILILIDQFQWVCPIASMEAVMWIILQPYWLLPRYIHNKDTILFLFQPMARHVKSVISL
jgi:hypothetical protein